LDNTDKVVEFKTELVRQFYEMRKLLAERQTEVWIEMRKQGKLIRREETDVIQQLVEYAKNQGSENSQMLYMTYTKLANRIVGVSNRDSDTHAQLNDLSTMERLIAKVVLDGMEAGTYYKQIYQNCKERLETVKKWLVA
jgi:polyhydroxyalkanoate synthesis regulator phasin